MKTILLVIMGLFCLLSIGVVSFVLIHDRRYPVVPCFVIADDAPVYYNPGSEFKAISHGVHGMVDVVGRKGDWCQLTDGTYMPAYCLTPARVGESIRQL
jgi:hypothetical protein